MDSPSFAKKRKIDIAYSYDEAVELTGHGKYNYLLLATCMLVANALAMDMFGLSVVVEASKCDLQLNIFTAGLLNSTPLVGVVLFAFPCGYFADRKGRRTALLLSTTCGFFFGVLSSFSPNWITMLILKFIGCSFSTTSYTLTMTYVGESVGNAHRSRYLFLLNTANLAAELVFYGLAYAVLPLNFSIPVPWLGITIRPWRLYNLVLVTPLGIGALLLFTLYESPKILASMGKTKQALQVLNDIYKWNGGKDEYPVRMLHIGNEEGKTKGPIWKNVMKRTLPLFKPPLLWRTIQLYYLIAVCSATNNAFLMWYPMTANLFFSSISDGNTQSQSFCERIASNTTISDSIEDVNYTCDDTIYPNTMYAGMLLGLTFAAINLAASAVASYRKLVLIACYLVSGVCLVLVNLLREPVINMVVFTMVQITAIGAGSVSTYFVDLYPTSSRGIVSSLSMVFMRIFGLAAINIVGPLILNYCRFTFYGWAVYVASGIVVAIFLPSDKKIHK